MTFRPPQNNFPSPPSRPPLPSPADHLQSAASSGFLNSFSANITMAEAEQMGNPYEQCILSLESEIKGRESERAKLIEAVRQLESEAQTAAQKQRETARTSEQLAIRVRSLEERTKTQDATLNDNKRVISNLTILNRQLQDSLAAIRGETDRQGQAERTLLLQLQRLQDDTANAQNQMQARIESKDKEYTAARNEVSRLSALLQQTAATVAQKEAQLAASAAARAREQEEYAQLLRASQKKGNSSQILVGRIEQLQNSITEFQRTGSRQDATIALLTSQLAAHQQETVALNAQLANYHRNMQLLNQEKEAFTTKSNDSQKLVDQLTRDNRKLAMEIDDLKLTLRDLSSNGSSLDSEVAKLKERNRELHRQLEDLREESVDKEAEIAELRIRIGKERETAKAHIENFTTKFNKISQTLSQKEIDYDTLKKTSKMVRDDLEYKLKHAQLQLESTKTNLSEQCSQIETLYQSLKGESSEKIAALQATVATQKTTITQLEGDMVRLKDSVSNRQSFEKERETILQNYSRSERSLREIIESVKQSLLSKDKELRAMEEANSTLRHQNTKLLEQEAQMRKDFNLIKASIAQAKRLKHKRTTSSTNGFDALPERPDSENKYMRSSIQSVIARDKKSGYLDRKSTMGQYSNE